MGSLWAFTFIALVGVALASATSCRDQNSSTSVSVHHTTSWRSTLMHNGQQPNTTKTEFLKPTSITTSKHLLPSLPWLSNHSTTGIFPTSRPSPRPTATVVVGKGGELRFSPASLNATIGSVVSFNFLGINHTLTQSEFLDPCHSNGGFNTGFEQFNPSNISGKFVVEYEVRDTAPQWFFCAQNLKRPHCQAGMVFSLNPNGRHAQFLENALAAVTQSSNASACRVLVPTSKAYNTSVSSDPTGTVSAGLGASSGTVFPPISNSGSARGISWAGMMLVWVFL